MFLGEFHFLPSALLIAKRGRFVGTRILHMRKHCRIFPIRVSHMGVVFRICCAD
jgi:hypothetical protein